MTGATTVDHRRKIVDPVTDDQRCTLTELIKEQCAHCKQGTRRPTMVTDLFDGPAGGGDHDVVYTFTAQWPGRCHSCDETFGAGTTVARTLNGDLICGGCT